MELDLTLILWFIAAVTLSSLVQSAMGFGFAMVGMTVLPMLLGIKDANVIASITSMFSAVIAAWTYRKGLDTSSFLACTTTAVCFLPLGLLALTMVPADILTRVTGLAIFVIAIEGVIHRNNEPGEQKSLKYPKFWAIMAGGWSGFLSGALSIGGPPIVAYASRQNWTPLQFKAFVSLFLLTVTLSKTIGMAAIGLVNEQILWLTLIGFPFCIIGSHVGVWISSKMDPKLFQLIVLSMLACISLTMMVRGSA